MTDRGAHRVIEVAEALPARGNFHRVDECAVAEHRRHPVAHVIAVLEPRPARVLALVARARGLELGERQRGFDLGANARAFEADDHPATAPRDLLGDGAEHAIDELALAERRLHGALTEA